MTKELAMTSIMLSVLFLLSYSAMAHKDYSRFVVTGKAKFHPWSYSGNMIEKYAERDADEKAFNNEICQSAPTRISEFTYNYVPYGTVSATATYECYTGN
jgi:hypothetical protein